MNPMKRQADLRKKLFFLTLFCLLLLIRLQAQETEVVCDPSKSPLTELKFWKMQDGDKPGGSAVDFDDSGWEAVDRDHFYPQNRGLHWLRTTVIIGKEQHEYPYLLRIGRIQSAFEVFCNGFFVGRNGTVGTDPESERPGRLLMAVLLDHYLRPGKNVISVRFSDFQFTPPGFFFYAFIDSRLNPNFMAFRSLLKWAITIGIMLTGAVIGLMFFMTGGSYRNYFFYFLMCAAFLWSSGFRFVMHVANISLDMLEIFEPIFIGGYYVADLSIVLFLLFTFQFRKKRFHILAAILLCAAFYLGSVRGSTLPWLTLNRFNLILIPYILYLTIHAVGKRKKGSVIALLGFVAYTILRSDCVSFTVFSFFGSGDLAQPLLIIAYVMVARRQILEREQGKRNTELKARRLESELLKKAIQPHFVMNTLASLQSLSKRRPDKAEQMIQAIADEYRRINEIMNMSMIPIEEELDLCRTHLDLMGFRREARYELRIESSCPGSLIPPLIFHTLVENGLTHAMRPKEDGFFIFNCRREERRMVYSLANNGSLLAGDAGFSNQEIEEGTGIRYVKSRLEEAFPGKWEMDYAMTDGMWRVIIVIKDR